MQSRQIEVVGIHSLIMEHYHDGPQQHRRLSQRGVPPGWIRIALDQIEHKSGNARIKKIVFRAGGSAYRVWYKDRKGVWCAAPNWKNNLAEALELSELLLTQNRSNGK